MSGDGVITAADVIARLGLLPHPEGGYYREIFRSELSVARRPSTAGDDGAIRSALTSIYFLLEAGDFSAWHRVASDEVWHVVAGGPLELHTIDAAGTHRCEALTAQWGDNWRPQLVVPAGALQAAHPATDAEWILCTCLVAPGFEFADFEMPTLESLLREYPQHEDVLRAFTREH